MTKEINLLDLKVGDTILTKRFDSLNVFESKVVKISKMYTWFDRMLDGNFISKLRILNSTIYNQHKNNTDDVFIGKQKDSYTNMYSYNLLTKKGLEILVNAEQKNIKDKFDCKILKLKEEIKRLEILKNEECELQEKMFNYKEITNKEI